MVNIVTILAKTIIYYVCTIYRLYAYYHTDTVIIVAVICLYDKELRQLSNIRIIYFLFLFLFLIYYFYFFFYIYLYI
jgi:hypothetical protein